MSELVSKCVLRVEVNDPSADGGAEASSEPKTGRKSRDISVETFPSRLESPREDWGLLPVCSRETTPLEPEDPKSEIGFFSGNPFVEITKGILHLYKEDVLSDRKEALTLCLLGVPTSMTCHDLLAFTAPCHADIAHIRVLRDSLPNQYMALLTFRTHDSAMEFYVTFNGGPFNSLEPDNICRIVWVSRVEWAHDGVPPPGHTELPICPVCLERMDESVDGVLTILCNHAFHANCLEQWGDSTCPVCRCVQSPEQAASSECEQCGKVAQSADALWICLICGHVGCGRYQGGHAALHYRESGHCYALQLGSHRVWDYKGDNFVHRLLQNKADGKLVPSEGPPSEAECAQEKVDSVQLEFTYLLTSQLEEQRLYFEDKLAQLDSIYYAENSELKAEVLELSEKNSQLKTDIANLTKEKLALERKIAQQSVKLNATLNDLNEEKQLGKALRNNQQQWQTKLGELQAEKDTMAKEITELREQVRDLMFFIDAKQVIEKSDDRDDIAGGTITVGAEPAKNKRKGKKKR
ncbi:BRCA1-associated protein [Tribolium castaneum]|uniref:BRCA1-associated protein-like Protein n=1 Tax=Tribolium castaneum TaxID=7070 RepID=D2A5C1_TRICA|nr:PREDICTED: BRCA1-associated protein [Tribolium castaneum]EFA05346.2 BRCA1-associated protein-like Protein [Tribolium castaneum]|eukprot:XP_008194660.1 PREDICTED: BRCA1-associated protein [Tribolium castaneum]